MAWNRSTCLVLALSFVAQELQAWPLQPPNRKARSIDDRAQDLFATLRNDPDETKRAVAAEELRLVDPKQHSELLGCLIDALTELYTRQCFTVKVEQAKTFVCF